MYLLKELRIQTAWEEGKPQVGFCKCMSGDLAERPDAFFYFKEAEVDYRHAVCKVNEVKGGSFNVVVDFVCGTNPGKFGEESFLFDLPSCHVVAALANRRFVNDYSRWFFMVAGEYGQGARWGVGDVKENSDIHVTGEAERVAGAVFFIYRVRYFFSSFKGATCKFRDCAERNVMKNGIMP